MLIVVIMKGEFAYFLTRVCSCKRQFWHWRATWKRRATLYKRPFVCRLFVFLPGYLLGDAWLIDEMYFASSITSSLGEIEQLRDVMTAARLPLSDPGSSRLRASSRPMPAPRLSSRLSHCPRPPPLRRPVRFANRSAEVTTSDLMKGLINSPSSAAAAAAR